MGKWNDTDEPRAYLVTFRTYGTRLAGDDRGSIDKYHNGYGGPRAVASSKRNEIHEGRLKSKPLLLNANARKQVEAAIRDVCAQRRWTIIAISVRTNHIHVVVEASTVSTKMLNDWKSYSTRRLREVGEWQFRIARGWTKAVAASCGQRNISKGRRNTSQIAKVARCLNLINRKPAA